VRFGQVLKGENASPRIAAQFYKVVVLSVVCADGRLSHLCCLQDSMETQATQGLLWEVGVSLDKGHAQGMWSLLCERLHQYAPFYDCNVCDGLTTIQGV
jgi:hypothetical protein